MRFLAKKQRKSSISLYFQKKIAIFAMRKNIDILITFISYIGKNEDSIYHFPRFRPKQRHQ